MVGHISRYTIKLTLQISSYPLIQQGGIGPYEFLPHLLLTVDKARAGPENVPSLKPLVRVHMPTTCGHTAAGADRDLSLCGHIPEGTTECVSANIVTRLLLCLLGLEFSRTDNSSPTLALGDAERTSLPLDLPKSF